MKHVGCYPKYRLKNYADSGLLRDQHYIARAKFSNDQGRLSPTDDRPARPFRFFAGAVLLAMGQAWGQAALTPTKRGGSARSIELREGLQYVRFGDDADQRSGRIDYRKTADPLARHEWLLRARSFGHEPACAPPRMVVTGLQSKD